MSEFQNEFQAAYYASQRLQAERNRIEVPDGLFAVIECSLAYCGFTDATLPNPNRRVAKLVGTPRIAAYFAAKMNAACGEEECGEVWYEVYPAPEPVEGDEAPGFDSPRSDWTGFDSPEMDDNIPF